MEELYMKKILGLSLRFHHFRFSIANTKGAEVLYSIARDFIGI